MVLKGCRCREVMAEALEAEHIADVRTSCSAATNCFVLPPKDQFPRLPPTAVTIIRLEPQSLKFSILNYLKSFDNTGARITIFTGILRDLLNFNRIFSEKLENLL